MNAQLAHAQEIRAEQGEVRRVLAELSCGEAKGVAAAMLEKPSEAVGRLTAGRLLECIPQIGRLLSNRIIQRAGLPATARDRRVAFARHRHRRPGPLSERERKALAVSLREFGE